MLTCALQSDRFVTRVTLAKRFLVAQKGNIVLALKLPKIAVMESPINPTEDLTGMTLVERFHITGKLGQGGMGSIYTAHDSILARDVAIKTIARTNLNDQELMRFQREAKAASTLSHPNVIQMLDFGVLESGQPFMVMELIEGISLAQLISERGPQSPRLVLQIIEQVANGMIGFHKAGIVHRDLKTGNIMLLNSGMLTNQPLAKILDFGIAKALGTEAQMSTITKAGQIFGSPNSMSPEQARGDTLDHRSDIYSLGCIAFELLTGRPLFVGDTVIDVVTQHINDPPPRLWEACDLTFPMELERLVAHMVLKDPDERFQSMSEVIKNLRDVYAVLPEETERKASDVTHTAALPAKELSLNSGVLWASGVLAVIALICSVSYIVNKFTIANAPPPPKPSPFKAHMESGEASLDMVDILDGDAPFALSHAGKVTRDLEVSLAKKKKLQDLTLVESQIVPRDLELIAKLQPVNIKLIDCNGLTDDVMKGLSNVSSVRCLIVHNGKGITPGSLTRLQSLPKLSTLSLFGCDISNDHLKVLRNFPTLRYLRLGHNKNVTMDGVRYLSGRKRTLGVEVDDKLFFSLNESELQKLKKNNHIALFKSEMQTDMSTETFEKLGGFAMDDLFGPVGNSKEKIDKGALHDALEKTINFD